jgi:aminopeptidase YwaD
VLLLRGEIASEPLMPKNFPFYTEESHQRILRALEARSPAAVITAAAANPQMAGAQYPYPLIEDGDFELPSAYMTAEEGERLAKWAGEIVTLKINSRRIPAQGYNVVARKQPSAARRVVLFAHIDTKEGTPGALDNAAGVTVLLLLASLLEDYSSELGVEIVAMNGEDYYSAPGQVDYLRRNQSRLEQVALGINLDGVGYVRGKTAYSLYDCPQPIENRIRQEFSTRNDLTAGDPWYQGDHMLFIQNQRPALAFTSEPIGELMSEVIHTEQDRPELVDRGRLATLALALKELIEGLS